MKDRQKIADLVERLHRQAGQQRVHQHLLAPQHHQPPAECSRSDQAGQRADGDERTQPQETPGGSVLQAQFDEDRPTGPEQQENKCLHLRSPCIEECPDLDHARPLKQLVQAV